MSMPSTPLQIVITSYNRGRFLAHCVETVEQCMPGARIDVRDDGSDDPETLRVLDAIAARHAVHRGAGEGGGKHGGLYGHMQAALDTAHPDTLLLYLQDDVQMVRPVSTAAVEALYRLFRAEPRLGFVSPSFIPTSGKGRTRDAGFDHSADLGVFWPKPQGGSAGIYYSDINICLPSRLHDIQWHFGSREPECEALAKRHFRTMAIPELPFVAWLPLVPAYRGKRKTWALSRAERQRNAGFHPFRLLRPEDAERLRLRQPMQPPWAETLLMLRDGDLPHPWHHNPLQGRRWLKRLNNLETALARWWGR